MASYVSQLARGGTDRGDMLESDLDSPLASQERDELEVALRAVHRDLRGLLSALPVEVQTATGLARSLEIERTTCQRAVSAVNQPYPGTSLVGQLPGVAGLRALTDAAAARWAGVADIQQALTLLRASVDRYAALVLRTAGSRAKLLTRLSASDDVGHSVRPGHEQNARQLFDAAAALTGRQSQTWLAVHIYEPTNRADRLQQTRAHGLIGHTAREDAVPLTFHVFATSTPGVEAFDDAAELGRFCPLAPATKDDGAPPEVLRAYSSNPPPVVRARQPNEFLVQTVDSTSAPGSACDLMFGLRGLMAHPGGTPPFMEEVWAMINFPARWLLFDVFLHREIARRCIPGLDVHLWRPDFAATAGERWQTRFAAGGPRLESLGQGLEQVASAAFARHGELLRFLFETRGLNAAEYVGYRCQTAYPMWRTGYRMTFDFGEPG